MSCHHCLGLGCVHCREQQAEKSFQQRRSRLSEPDRIALGLFTRPLRRRNKKPRGNVVLRQSQCGTPVLPASFSL
jgi:hypothetical protein